MRGVRAREGGACVRVCERGSQRERERETQRKKERERKREREREGGCSCAPLSSRDGKCLVSSAPAVRPPLRSVLRSEPPARLSTKKQEETRIMKDT